MLTVLAAFRWTRERPPVAAAVPEDVTTMWQQIRQCLRNRPFLLVTEIFFFSWLCLALVQNNLLLYARYVADVESQFAVSLLIVQVTAMVFLSGWNRVCQSWGKQRVYAAGAVIWIVGLVALFWAPRGVVAPYYGMAFLTGIGASVAYIIPWSMLPDVIEYDQLRTAQRRDGLFYGMFVLLQQVGLSFGLAASNVALEMAGYVMPQGGQVVTQPHAVQTTLRVLVSFVPAGLLLLCLPLAYVYPITKERFAEIRQRLADQA
jgi:GPH family glycoside/pentoside/hexuronide:cation symporter